MIEDILLDECLQTPERVWDELRDLRAKAAAYDEGERMEMCVTHGAWFSDGHREWVALSNALGDEVGECTAREWVRIVREVDDE